MIDETRIDTLSDSSRKKSRVGTVANLKERHSQG